MGSWAEQGSWATFSAKVNRTNFKVVFSTEKNADTRRKVALFSANKICAIHFGISWRKRPFPPDFALIFFTRGLFEWIWIGIFDLVKHIWEIMFLFAKGKFYYWRYEQRSEMLSKLEISWENNWKYKGCGSHAFVYFIVSLYHSIIYGRSLDKPPIHQTLPFCPLMALSHVLFLQEKHFPFQTSLGGPQVFTWATCWFVYTGAYCKNTTVIVWNNARVLLKRETSAFLVKFEYYK